MRPSEALAKNRDKVLEIIARYAVSNPRIFGSVARGEDTEGSDLDIVVDPEGTFSYFDMAGLALELEALHPRIFQSRRGPDLANCHHCGSTDGECCEEVVACGTVTSVT
jgi:predicted nucleotidyltransferase